MAGRSPREERCGLAGYLPVAEGGQRNLPLVTESLLAQPTCRLLVDQLLPLDLAASLAHVVLLLVNAGAG